MARIEGRAKITSEITICLTEEESGDAERGQPLNYDDGWNHAIDAMSGIHADDLRDAALYQAPSRGVGAQGEGPKCGKFAASFIPRRGEYFSCVLEPNHEGECRPGGTCFKHGPYVGEPNRPPLCQHWPDCVEPAASQQPSEQRSGIEGMAESILQLIGNYIHDYLTH